MGMQLRVVYVGGGEDVVEVEATHTVADLMKSAGVSMIRFGDDVLSSDTLLADVGVASDDTLHEVCRYTGQLTASFHTFILCSSEGKCYTSWSESSRRTWSSRRVHQQGSALYRKVVAGGGLLESKRTTAALLDDGTLCLPSGEITGKYSDVAIGDNFVVAIRLGESRIDAFALDTTGEAIVDEIRRFEGQVINVVARRYNAFANLGSAVHVFGTKVAGQADVPTIKGSIDKVVFNGWGCTVALLDNGRDFMAWGKDPIVESVRTWMTALLADGGRIQDCAVGYYGRGAGFLLTDHRLFIYLKDGGLHAIIDDKKFVAVDSAMDSLCAVDEDETVHFFDL